MSSQDLAEAKRLLDAEALTIAVVKGDETWTSKERGLAALTGWVAAGIDLRDAAAADLVVGKAAALLYIHAGVTSVYARLLSEPAAAVLEKHGIAVVADEVTAFIRNRAGDGMCPMEQAVQDLDDPPQALDVVQQTAARLRAGR